MDSNITKFKCILHYNGTNQGSIMHSDLAYTMLQDMIMKKFKLEANYPLNLSAKLLSFDDIFDITNDNEVQFFVECACNSKDEIAHLYVSQHKIHAFMHCLRPLLIIDATYLKGQHKGTNLVAVGMDGNNQIVQIAFVIALDIQHSLQTQFGGVTDWYQSSLLENQAHDPDYMPEPMYPEYIPLEDKHVFLAEEQPLPLVDSPTAESPGFVAESDPEEDPEELEDDETEDSPVDYPMDGEDDGDDDDGDSSGDDTDDEDEDEEEEGHLAPADSAVVVPTVEHVSPPEGTELVIPPASTDMSTTGARITIRLQASISLPPEAEVERLLAMTTPSPSPPILLSPPSVGERPVIASIRALINVSYCRITLPHTTISYTYHHLIVTIGHDVPEVRAGHPRKRFVFVYSRPPALWNAERRQSGLVRLGRVTELAELNEHDTLRLLYALLEDAQGEELWRSEAYAFPRGLGFMSIGMSQAVHFELQTHHEQTQHQVLEIAFNAAADDGSALRRLTEMSDMQAELLAHRGQHRRARQSGSDARAPDHQEASRDADSHI
ncbi:hypothetical protein Tco_0894474 [Tanacetum coccineum]|uniref:MULE transposase domain-containing protein n=1 Tax=Tanacetum coccineum TaxID=301880 RepID=A0ABQ5CEB4_9ASTR